MSVLDDSELKEFNNSLSTILSDLILNVNITRYVDYSFELTIKKKYPWLGKKNG